jgi:DNA polymerase-3 subunit alpha
MSKGDTVGVFQMESSGMRNLLAQLRPGSFEDVIAVLALFRPGPLDSGMVDEFIKRKHGKKEVQYLHPKLEPILEHTYGVIVYQEQVMQIAQALAGYSLGDADNLRRAMGKKDAGKMKKERQRFIDGAGKRGIAEKQAVEIFDQMETFAMYGFNKSHSAAYALISFQTAYLKAHYPEEFLAALLTLEMSDTDKTFKNIAECRERGIRILPPDVNESREDFTVLSRSGEKGMRPIRFGLCAVRGVGTKAVEAALAVRDKDGPFKSLADFCKRTQGSQVNKKVLEGLLKCGAFDFCGASRHQLLEGLEKAVQWGASHARDDGNQIGLFAAEAIAAPEPPLPDVPPWSDREMLKAEREALGFYITAHPLDKYERDLRRFTTGAIETLRGRENQTKVSVGGVIQSLRLRNNKKGDRYASFTLEDKSGTVEVICWPETYKRTEIDLTTDEPVCVSGSLEVGEERLQVIADSVDLLTRARERTVQQVHFALCTDRVDGERLLVLRQTLTEHRGQCPAFVHLLLPDRTETIIALPAELRVAPTEAMVDAVEQLFGRGVASFQ